MFCVECGTKLEDGMKFCPGCGTKVGNGNANSTVVETVSAFQEGEYYRYSFRNTSATIQLQKILQGTKKVRAIVQKGSMACQLYPNTRPIDQRFEKSKSMKDYYQNMVSNGYIVEWAGSALAEVQRDFMFEGSLSALATMLSGESIAPVKAWKLVKMNGTVQQGIEEERNESEQKILKGIQRINDGVLSLSKTVKWTTEGKRVLLEKARELLIECNLNDYIEIVVDSEGNLKAIRRR